MRTDGGRWTAGRGSPKDDRQQTIDHRLSSIVHRLPSATVWREHGAPLALYAVLTLALTWPAARDFTSRLVSDGGDARNNLWMIWHVKQALLGEHHLFEVPLLYYPVGVNLLSRGLGPVVGLLALPFWPLGFEAAYNGSLLVGFWLTGYFMYLLARGLGLERRAAFFAGLFLLAAPMHLAGVNGHMTKTFLGLMPLGLLCLVKSLDDGRRNIGDRQSSKRSGIVHRLRTEVSLRWSVATAVVLLLILFHNGYQFIFTGLAFAFFTAARLWVAEGAERRVVLLRAVATAVVALVVVAPFALLFVNVAQDPEVAVGTDLESLGFHPDVVELLVPPRFSALWGRRVGRFLERQGVETSIETNVYLTWTGLLLAGAAWRRGSRRARPWLLFALFCALLALGPSLKWLGEVAFTKYRLPVLMPYALVTELPGFEFMRAPGRFMMIGSVAMGVGAAFGLAWLSRRYPQWATALLVAAAALLLVEVWPRPWRQEALHPVPAFYEQIAQEGEVYGVFDLPVKPEEQSWFVGYSSYYQRYQMVHEKGIASGYLARTYETHPLFPCVIPEFKEAEPGVFVDGEPADCAANLLHDLAFYNYRYVVYHKPDLDGRRFVGSWGRAQVRQFLARYFPGEEPLVDDRLVTVYAVPTQEEAARGLSPALGLLAGWHVVEAEDPEAGTVQRWARSPATLFLSAPRAQTVWLEITPGLVFEPIPERGQVLGHQGQMRVALNGEVVGTMSLTRGEPARISLQVEPGVHRVSLSLEAGNFRPVDYELGEDRRVLSFMVQRVELLTDDDATLTDDGR